MPPEDQLTEDELADGSGALDATGATKREGQFSARRAAVPAPAEERLERGTLVGRYVVLDVLGAGGMGVVYAAYDPELDRKVAIKLLQDSPAGGGTGGEQGWLLREAQALARLSHPNVVAVHDVGVLPGDRVFVAMELVDGLTLRKWLKDAPRTWREVRPVMLAAGAGLAAAHAAGLVHRDFKPENVLVGSDGRVRVMDFGLARLHADAPIVPPETADLHIESRSPLSESLTAAGSVLGTPAYMAPEIYDGIAANARSDQFAFGVALYEALYRTRPYDKKALVPPRDAAVKPKVPPDLGVPARIERIVLRAVSIDPDARYPSMDDLLAALAIDPLASRRRVMIGAGLVAVLGAAIAGAATLSGGHADQLCKGVDRRLAGIWDPATKQLVHTAFDATKRPFAGQAFVAVAGTLDSYANGWTDAVVETCEATRIRGEQTEEVLSLRQDCLDQRLEELRAFTQLLGKADNAIVEKADNAALALEPLRHCANVAALRAPTQPPPEARAKVDQARVQLAEAKANFKLGDLKRSAAVATEVAAALKAIPFPPLEAEARFVLGQALLQMGNAKDAAVALADATWMGLRTKRDDVAAQAALSSAVATAEGLSKDGEARLWLALGGAAAARVGVDRALELKQLEIEGIVAGSRGDLTAAAAAHEKAYATAVQMYGVDGTLVSRDEQLLAATLAKSGEWASARPHYEHGLALVEAHLGPDHPDVALMLSGLGACYRHLGDRKKSHAAFERALAIRERIFGAASPVLITTLNNIAELLYDEGDAAAGLTIIARAKAIAEKTVGHDHPYYHGVSTTLGELLALAGRVDEGRTTLDDILVLEDKTHSPYLPNTLTVRGALARSEQKWAEAQGFYERAIAGYEASSGKDASDLWKPLTGLALAKIGLGQQTDARPLLERALAIGTKAHVTAEDLAPTRAALDLH